MDFRQLLPKTHQKRTPSLVTVAGERALNKTTMQDATLLDSPLSDLDRDAFASFFDDYLSQSSVREHSVVEGKVINIDGDWVTIDIGYKAEGTVAKSEFVDDDGKLTIEVGSKVDVYLATIGGNEGRLVLSKERADQMKAWEEIAKAHEAEKTVKGMVIARVKGGLSVDIGVKAFLPGSQVDLRPVKNLDKLLGETLEFKIIKFNKRRGNIVLSRRVLLEEERKVKRAETLKHLEVEAIMVGIVKNITDYGAFIDLGGIDGLLHITDMTYGRINHPKEMVEVGQEIEVKVLKFDADTQRVSLGCKQIRPDPWHEVDLRYPVGAIVRGAVVSMPDYGIFVQLEDGIEGLVHISEMTWNKRVKHPSKLVEMGQVVEAKVLGVDVENKRISLGMRQLEPNPWDVVEERYPVGTIIKGAVRNITDFGVFVGIEEGIDGLVHISDLSWSQRISHPSDLFQKGDELEARVLNIDRENERFSLGIKQLGDDPWLSLQSRYFLSQVVNGKVVSRTDFGVFVEIEHGVEGLVHMSELAHDDDWETNYPDGKELTVEIRRVDAHDRKLSLSEKGADGQEAGDDAAGDFIARQGDGSTRLGDVLGDLSKKLTLNAPEAPAGEVEAAAPEAPAEEAAAAAPEAPAEEAEAEAPEAPAEEAEAEAPEAPAEEAAAEE
jgi:small subunit ribosomal protein S1